MRVADQRYLPACRGFDDSQWCILAACSSDHRGVRIRVAQRISRVPAGRSSTGTNRKLDGLDGNTYYSFKVWRFPTRRARAAAACDALVMHIVLGRRDTLSRRSVSDQVERGGCGQCMRRQKWCCVVCNHTSGSHRAIRLHQWHAHLLCAYAWRRVLLCIARSARPLCICFEARGVSIPAAACTQAQEYGHTEDRRM